MTKHRNDIVYGHSLPQDMVDSIQEFISTYMSPNFAVTIVNPTTLRVVAGTGNDQVAIGINGRWRYNAANADAAMPGGLADGDHPIFVAASDNSFSGGGGGTNETDSTDYTFRLILLASGSTPTGTGTQALYRQVGFATVASGAITAVRLIIGGVSSQQVAAAIQKFGLLSARPAAASSLNIEFLATDDHGGTSYESNGTSWLKKAASVNGEWPLGSVVEWPWAAASIPAYTALPYGQSLLRVSYPDLATLDTAAGTPHGVVASNIVMPDYRGRAGVGKDDMGGSAANRITVGVSGVSGATLGAVFGAEGITLTTGQLPAHNHGVTGTPGISDPTHVHVVSPSGQAVIVSGGGGAASSQGGVWGGGSLNAALTGITVSAGTLATANAGSGSAHQNTQPSIIVNKLMRVL